LCQDPDIYFISVATRYIQTQIYVILEKTEVDECKEVKV